MTYAIRLDEQGIIIGLESYVGLEGQIEIQPQDLQLVLDYLDHNPNTDIIHKLQEIQARLKALDIKTYKFIDGELTEQEYKPYKLEKVALRKEYNELEQQHVEKQPFDLALLTPIVEPESLIEVVEPTEEEILEDIIGETA